MEILGFGIILEFREVLVQLLITGGMGSKPANQNLTYSQGYYGKCEELGVLILIQEVQEVFSLIKAQLKLKGTLVNVVKWGASLEHRGCREHPH